jgi:hypothetical protein
VVHGLQLLLFHLLLQQFQSILFLFLGIRSFIEEGI